MSKKTIQISFFAVITVSLFVLLFFILKPYLGVIFISGIFAVVFYPIYEKLINKFSGRKNLAAFATTSLILIFVIVPVIIMSAFLLKEAIGLYNSISLGGGPQNLLSQADTLVRKISSLFPSGVVDSQINLELYIRNALNWIIGHFDSIFIAVFGGVLNFMLMLISMHYLFIFGDKIKNSLIVWSPLPDKYDEEFIQTLKSSINAVLRGRILVSIAQGIFIGIGFATFGVGSPVLWGFVGGVASFIPILGTSIITVPAVIYLFLSHSVGAGIGLLLWGAIAVGLVDNVVSVVFLKDKIRVHPLVILFSIFGGVEVFGPIGFLVGPVVVSAFIALMKIYPFIMSYKNESVS
jgi:predicted PurR-regulated permease PerM